MYVSTSLSVSVVFLLFVGLQHLSSDQIFGQAESRNNTSMSENSTSIDSTNLSSVVSAPMADNQSIEVFEDSNTTITLTGTDPTANKSLLFSLVSSPAYGNLSAISKTVNESAADNGTYASANTTYGPPENFYGTDNFKFAVSDESTNSSSLGTVRIRVNPVNDPPIANSGPDLVINEGTVATLNGTASRDPETAKIPLYLWSQMAGPLATLTGVETATPILTTPNVTSDTPLAFSLRVVDENGTMSSIADILNVTVRNLPSPEPVPFMPTVDTVYIYLFILVFALLVPLFYDLIQGYRHRDKEGRPIGTEGLSRTLLAYGIILIIAILSFHVIITVTNNMQNPNPDVRNINSSFVEITENMTTLFGGAVSAIIGFYFGQRAVEGRHRNVTGGPTNEE